MRRLTLAGAAGERRSILELTLRLMCGRVSFCDYADVVSRMCESRISKETAGMMRCVDGKQAPPMGAESRITRTSDDGESGSGRLPNACFGPWRAMLAMLVDGTLARPYLK